MWETAVNIVLDFVVKFWIEFAMAGMVSAVALLFKRHKATQLGVQALLRANIIGLYNKYIERNEIPIYERENLEQLYIQYKHLKGNGVVDGLRERLNKLPTPNERR